MDIPVDQVIGTCVRFGRMISEAQDPEKILPLLADTAVEHLGVDGALVLRVGEGEFLQVASSRGVPPESCSAQLSVETIGREMEQQLLASCGQQFAEVRTLPDVPMDATVVDEALAVLPTGPDGGRPGGVAMFRLPSVVGTIVDVYDDPRAFEVEFDDEDGVEIALLALKPEQLRSKRRTQR